MCNRIIFQKIVSRELIWVFSWNLKRMLIGEEHLEKKNEADFGQVRRLYVCAINTITTITVIHAAKVIEVKLLGNA